MGKLLSQKQINEYERDGFICPIDVLSEDELLTCNLGIEKFERDTGEEIDFPYKSRCHQIFSWADHLVHHLKFWMLLKMLLVQTSFVTMQHYGLSQRSQKHSSAGTRTGLIFSRPCSSCYSLGRSYYCR